MKGSDLIALLKGKEDFDIQLNVKYIGRSFSLTAGEPYMDVIEDYKKCYIVCDTIGMNHGFSFNDGKEDTKKQMKITIDNYID